MSFSMFSFFKRNPKSINKQEITLKLKGLHCVSCVNDIDLALENVDGVISSQTSFAKSSTKVGFNKTKINSKKIIKTIENLGYQVN